MRDILRRYQPTRIEDLTALNALYRPGPMQGGMLDDFIERKHGRKAIVYDLPELKPILEETYGVILYQEQVMQISSGVAGYSLGEADILRRAMGKKKAEEMAEQRDRFIKGALARKLPQKKAEKIFDLMEQFAGYGFNKSHSAAYAFLAFVTAYLKAHYPVDFMAALLTSETGNMAKVVKYINECRDMSITRAPARCECERLNFTPDGEAIRFGLGAVKNVGQSAVEAISMARQEVGRFRSIYQFCEHVDMGAINRRVIESLIKAGAMDDLEGTRAQLFAAVDAAIECGQSAWKDRLSGQGGLFGGDFAAEEHPEKPLPNVPDWLPKEKLQVEKELLGFYVTGHPLDQYRDKVKELATHDSGNLEGLAKGAEVALCGVLTTIQKPPQPRRQAVGVDAAGRSFRVGRSAGLHHAIRAAGSAAGGRSGSADARPGPAGGKRPDQGFGAGYRSAGCGARAAAVADLDQGAAGPQRRQRAGGGAATAVREEARRDPGALPAGASA